MAHSSMATTAYPVRQAGGGNAPSHQPVLASWTRAVERFNSTLTKDKKKVFELKDCPKATFEEFLQQAEEARARVESRRLPFTASIQNVLDTVNRYAAAGDVIVQHHSEYASLAWGALRFLFLFAAEEGSTSEKLSKALESIVQIICRAEEYAKLFSTHSESSTQKVFQSLQDNLTSLYAEVLNFLVRATVYFKKHSLRRRLSAGFTPFTHKFGQILHDVERYEKNVQSDVSLLRVESEKLREKYENGVWLKHADFAIDLRNLQDEHVSGTCRWFLESDTYKAWRSHSSRSQTSRLLWVQGRPGCGKSTIVTQVVQDLETLNGSIVLFVFCKEGEEDKSTLESILRNLAFQLLGRSPRSEVAHQIVRDARLAAKSPFARCDDIWVIIPRLLAESGQVHCVLDGLDECSSTISERKSFLNRLTSTFGSDRLFSRLMIVSQLELRELGDDALLWEYLQIQPSHVKEDIERFVSVKLDNSRVLNKHPEKDNLRVTIIENASGMILWAKLMIGELEYKRWDVHQVLRNPPRGLSSMYDAILSRILSRTKFVEDVQHALKVVLAATRPFRLEELALAVAVGKGLSDHEEYDLRGDAKAEGEVLVLDSSPLLTKMPDGTVELIHSSLKDHLVGPSIPSPLSTFRFQGVQVHEEMASIAISYLSFRCLDKRPEELEERFLRENCLLEYASRWMVHHVTNSGETRDLADRILGLFRLAQGWRWLERLLGLYGERFTDLQLPQSQLRAWAQSIEMSCGERNMLENFLVYLSLKSYEAAKSSSIDRLSVLEAMERLSDAYDIHGQLQEAEELAVHVMEERKSILGQEHRDTLRSMHDMVSIYHKQGRWREAETLATEVVELRKKFLGEEHPATLASISVLASVCRAQGRWTEAETLQMRQMEISKRVLGQDHANTLTSMNELAFIYSEQGRWRKAEALEIQVVETRRRVLGSDHPATLFSMNNLASTYVYRGFLDKAEELQSQVLEVGKRVLGLNHPSTLNSMSNLASIYRKQGRLYEAEELELQVLESRKRVLGLDHPDTLTSMANLASTYWQQGRLYEAQELGLQVLESHKRGLGLDHPDTLKSMANLASTYWDQGRLNEAEELGLQVLEAWKRISGLDHPHTLLSMANLACTYQQQGRLNEAEELQLQVLEAWKRISGLDHPHTLLSMHNLAWTWKDQGRVEKAIEVMARVVELSKAKLGVDHPHTKVSIASLEGWADETEWWPADFPCFEEFEEQREEEGSREHAGSSGVEGSSPQ